MSKLWDPDSAAVSQCSLGIRLVSVQISLSGSKSRMVGREAKMGDVVLSIERYLDVIYCDGLNRSGPSDLCMNAMPIGGVTIRRCGLIRRCHCGGGLSGLL